MPRTSSVLPKALARPPYRSPATLSFRSRLRDSASLRSSRSPRLSRRCGAVLAALLLAVGLAAVPSSPRPAYAAPHTVSYDRYSLIVDGQRLFLWSAEFHYWRLPSPDLWR